MKSQEKILCLSYMDMEGIGCVRELKTEKSREIRAFVPVSGGHDAAKLLDSGRFSGIVHKIWLTK